MHVHHAEATDLGHIVLSPVSAGLQGPALPALLGTTGSDLRPCPSSMSTTLQEPAVPVLQGTTDSAERPFLPAMAPTGECPAVLKLQIRPRVDPVALMSLQDFCHWAVRCVVSQLLIPHVCCAKGLASRSH